MAQYSLAGEVTSDGRLVVALPPGVPAGLARVTVEVPEADEFGPPEDYAPGDTRGIVALLRQWEAEGWRGTGRTAADVDAQIAEERDSWDR